VQWGVEHGFWSTPTWGFVVSEGDRHSELLVAVDETQPAAPVSGGEGFVVGPLGAREVRPQILALEAAAGVAAAELLELGIGLGSG
jgi:hypothetical protein